MKQKQKILIADDDHDFVQMLRERLEAAGYKTVCANEGVRAVEVAHKEHPDLALLDWKMPAGKGPAVAQILSEKDDTRHIPIIIITGVEEPGMEKRSEELGVKAFIRKPYDAKALLQKIHEVLEWKKYDDSL